jgi:uncharacterized protein (TIGR00369 family)
MPSIDELRTFFREQFPQCPASVEAIGEGRATMRQVIRDEHLRPGGTVSGPTMFTVADAAAYAAILGAIGIVPLAVTTNMSMTFLRRPKADRDLLARAELLKLGKRLAVADVRIYSEGDDAPVAHAVATYSIPVTPA